MPVQNCTKNNKPGYKWGEQGTCYTYTPGNTKERMEARLKAEAQRYAIRKSQERADRRSGGETP